MGVSVKKSIKTVLTGYLIGALSIITVMTASAYSSSSGSNGYYSANGISYYNYNTVSTGLNNYNEKFATAMINVHRNPTANIPAGWAATCPILYNSAGQIVKQGDWTYSSSGTSGMGTMVMLTFTSGSPSYYAEGITRAWNGSSYWTFGSFKSPSLNDYTR